MKFEISKYWQLLFSLLILIFSFSILAYLIFAWTPPTQSPPQGNVPAPINVGDQSQVKSGGIGAQTLASAYGAVFAYLGGKVGIGTTTPIYKLHVQGGDIFASGYVRGQTGLCIGSDCRTSWPSGGGGETYWAASGNNIYNTNSGNVGIGTTAPGETLDIHGVNLGMDRNDATYGPYINFYRQGTLKSRIHSGIGGDKFSIQNPAGSDRLVIDTSGNVGIGTTNPTQKLDVAGYVKGTGLCIGSDCRTSWPSGGEIKSVSLTQDVDITWDDWQDVPGMVLTFTAIKSEALVILTASGRALYNDWSGVHFRIVNVTTGTSIGGTAEMSGHYTGSAWYYTPWSCSFTKKITGLTVGNSYTLKVQWSKERRPTRVYAASNPDMEHVTLSIIQ